jgi:diguanylate cyclase (GGDEF)-like protein
MKEKSLSNEKTNPHSILKNKLIKFILNLMPFSIALLDKNFQYVIANKRYLGECADCTDSLTGKYYYDVLPRNNCKLDFHDSLTGLYNRAFFEEELKRLNTNRQLPLSVILGDANGLKLTNDVLGHKQGDKLLETIGKILKESCREEDIVARLSGDEFAILLPKTGEEGVRKICERINFSCAAYKADFLKPSISLGYGIKTSYSENIEDILKTAEDMMYKNKLRESKETRKILVSSLKNHMETRTFEAKEHLERLQSLSIKLAHALGLSDVETEQLNLLSAFHDIGKSAIPDYILKKTDPLSDAEWVILKRHCETGYRIASADSELSPIADFILYHHEYWNGKGYPLGLKRDEIPKLSRIFSVVDAYDVMTHCYPYHEAISEASAIAELKRCSGSQFDPYITEVFISLLTN